MDVASLVQQNYDFAVGCGFAVLVGFMIVLIRAVFY